MQHRNIGAGFSEITGQTGRSTEQGVIPSKEDSISNLQQHSMHALLKSETHDTKLLSNFKKKHSDEHELVGDHEKGILEHNEDLLNVIKRPSADSMKRTSISTTYAAQATGMPSKSHQFTAVLSNRKSKEAPHINYKTLSPQRKSTPPENRVRLSEIAHMQSQVVVRVKSK